MRDRTVRPENYYVIYNSGAQCLVNIEVGTGEPINYSVPMWSFILSKK